MAMTMRGEPGYHRVTFALDIEDDWPPVSTETLWVRAAQDGRFRIDSIPFLAKRIAVDDLVEVEGEPEGVLRFSRKVESGGHSTIQLIMMADEGGSAVSDEVKKIGCDIERSSWPSLFSIDIPDGKLLSEVHRALDARVASGEIEYVNACIVW